MNYLYVKTKSIISLHREQDQETKVTEPEYLEDQTGHLRINATYCKSCLSSQTFCGSI